MAYSNRGHGFNHGQTIWVAKQSQDLDFLYAGIAAGHFGSKILTTILTGIFGAAILTT